MTYREKKPGLEYKKAQSKRGHYSKQLIKKILAVQEDHDTQYGKEKEIDFVIKLHMGRDTRTEALITARLVTSRSPTGP